LRKNSGKIREKQKLFFMIFTHFSGFLVIFEIFNSIKINFKESKELCQNSLKKYKKLETILN
jgi:hypothetical protein